MNNLLLLITEEVIAALRHAQTLYGDAQPAAMPPTFAPRRNPVRRVRRAWRHQQPRAPRVQLVSSVTTGNPTKAQERAYARSLFARHGWGPEQMASLEKLWDHESGDPTNPAVPWNPHAHNASGASGIAQFMPYTQPYFNAGGGTGDWQTQIREGLQYISDRYSSPDGAWAQYYHHAHGEGSY